MNEDKKEKAAKHIEKELCIAGMNAAYEVRCMLDACEKAVIDRVLEIIGGYKSKATEQTTLSVYTYNMLLDKMKQDIFALKEGAE